MENDQILLSEIEITSEIQQNGLASGSHPIFILILPMGDEAWDVLDHRWDETGGGARGGNLGPHEGSLCG